MTDNLTAEVKLCRKIGFQTGISFCFAKNRRMAGSVYREAEPNTLSCSAVTARKRKSFGNCINAYAGINAAPVCRRRCATRRFSLTFAAWSMKGQSVMTISTDSVKNCVKTWFGSHHTMHMDQKNSEGIVMKTRRRTAVILCLSVLAKE